MIVIRPAFPENNIVAINRLTALWALAESGLGGMMFAFKIPFTGFIIGAVAMVLLSLIAKFSNNSYKQIINATIIVIIVKAAVSPHSPLPAYIAVAFQGFMAAVFFSLIRSHKIACIFLGIVSMAESALQKIFVLTFIFGKNIWEAFNNLFNEISKNLSIQVHHNYALWVLSIYVFIYMVWGTLVGLFANGIPKQIEIQKDFIIENYKRTKSTAENLQFEKKKNRKVKWMIGYLLILIFIITVFLLSGADAKKVLWILLRTIAALLLLFYVIQPLLKYLFKRWLTKRTNRQQVKSQEIITMMPGIKNYTHAAYSMAAIHKGFFKRLRSFVINMITLTLYAE